MSLREKSWCFDCGETYPYHLIKCVMSPGEGGVNESDDIDAAVVKLKSSFREGEYYKSAVINNIIDQVFGSGKR